jgi:hypothetical protein
MMAVAALFLLLMLNYRPPLCGAAPSTIYYLSTPVCCGFTIASLLSRVILLLLDGVQTSVAIQSLAVPGMYFFFVARGYPVYANTNFHFTLP